MRVNVTCEGCEEPLSVRLDNGYAGGQCRYCLQDIEVELCEDELSVYGCEVAA